MMSSSDNNEGGGYFLITMPRAGGTALARMMGAGHDGCAAAFLEASRAAGYGAPLAGRGWRSIYYGHRRWEEAVAAWSWLLRSQPGMPLVFLTRGEDAEGAYEMSLFATVKRWVPAYGSCFGRTLTQTRRHREWMLDFHLMNPSRTILLDHADLADHAVLSAKLGALAPSFERWQALARERPNARKPAEGHPPPLPEGAVMAEQGEDYDPFEGFTEEVGAESEEEADEKPDEGLDSEKDPFVAGMPADEALARYRPQRPRPFLRFPAQHPRAIVYPWLSTAAKWEEIYYSLRSIEENFTDRECPIYLLGDAPPPRLKPGGRVRWLGLQGYATDRRSGLWHAFTTGLQLADEVCWMNDDICFLRPTGWEDLRVALTEGRLDARLGTLLTSGNLWKRGLGQAVADMKRLRPAEPVLRFATHTPFLFEREKSVEVLAKFHLPYKGSWVTTYHNYHQTPHRPCGALKVNRLPAPPEARYLNYNDHTLTPALKEELARRFPACRGGLMWGEIARGLGLLGDLRVAADGRIAEPRWGTVGCTISHLLCLRLATIAGGIVLFPDDAVNPAGHDLESLVAQALAHRPPGCGWVKLKNHHPVYAGPIHESGGWTFRRLAPVNRHQRIRANNGSAGAIILARQARAILKALPPATSNHFDYELRHIMDRVPGGCWEMCGTGIDVARTHGPFRGSARRRIDGR